MPLRGTRCAGTGAVVASEGWPHCLLHEAPAAGPHDAPALHRAGVAPPAGQPGASTEDEPHPLPWRVCPGGESPAISVLRSGGPGRGGGTSVRGGSSGHVPQASVRPEAGWAGLLRRTFALDVFACLRCGGRRRVLAYREGSRRGESASGAPGLPTASAHLAPARGPPQSAFVDAQAVTASQESYAPAASRLGRRLGRRVAAGDEWLLRRPGVRLMG